MNELIQRGSKREIQESEYPPIERQDASEKLSKDLMNAWEFECKKPHPKLWKCVLNVFGFRYAISGLAYFAEMIFKIGEAITLGYLLIWFGDPNGSIQVGLGWAFAFLHAVTHHVEFFIGMRIGMQVRVAFIAAIYRKCLSLSISNASSTGLIVNMVSNDVQRFEDVSIFIHFLYIGPLELFIVLYLMYLQISWAAFPAIGALLIFIPIQALFASQFGRLRDLVVKFRDERIKTLSDMLSGISVVKLYAWEHPFIKRIIDLRNKELKIIQEANIYRAINDATFFSSSGMFFE